MFKLSYDETVPFISTDQMREVDRAMIEDFEISLFQMMENAGRNLAELARNQFLNKNVFDKKIIILVGNGGNGGGGLVAARNLHNWGAQVIVVLATEKEALAAVPQQQLSVAEKIGITVLSADLFLSQGNTYDLIIDALIGYSLNSNPKGDYATLIEKANESGIEILSLDTPSGLDTTSGLSYPPTIKATATMTLALPKIGFKLPEAEAFIGELYLADISIPAELYVNFLELEVPRNLFSKSNIIKIKPSKSAENYTRS